MTSLMKIVAKASTLGFAISLLYLTSAAPGEAAQPASLVDAATATVEDYATGEYATLLKEQLENAGGVIVFPSGEQTGVTEGRQGWVGVGLARDPVTGVWSYPAFFTVISGTFGQEAGLQVRDVIFVVKGGMEQMVAARLKLETEAGLGVSTIVPGRGTQTPASPLTDIVAIPRVRERAGDGYVTFEGTVLEPHTDWNHAYYGSPYSTNDILMNERVSNPQADPLREALAGLVAEAYSPTD